MDGFTRLLARNFLVFERFLILFQGLGGSLRKNILGCSVGLPWQIRQKEQGKEDSRDGTNRVFGEPCFCPLPKGAVLTKTAKMTNLHSTH